MKRLALLFVVMFGLSACDGGGSESSPAVNDNIVSTITMVGGNNQTATVGTELPNPLVALILNKAGQPIVGQVVNFKVTSGSGSVFAGTATSDTSGFVRERWTLGTIAGSQKVEVRAVDSNGVAVVFATFNAIGETGTPQTVSRDSGNDQSAQQLQLLPASIKVIVKDVYGNPKSGTSVEFTTNDGGSVIPSTVITNVTGVAEAFWTLGQTVGTQTLNAVVTGLPPIVFGAVATQAPPSAVTAVAKISGDLQTVVQHSLIPIPFQVNVTDTLGNPVPETQVTYSASAGSGFIKPIIISTDSSGTASWSGYFHTAGQQKVDASVAGIATVTFNTNVTASNHQYDGRYLCIGMSGMDVLNGTYIGYGHTSGTINEADGKLTAKYDLYAGVINYSGQLVVDSLQRATGSGTFLNQSRNAGGILTTTSSGSWSCDRE